MKATPRDVEKYLRMISETPAHIEDVVRSLDGERLHFKADARSWSASDLLSHLRSCADLWTHSIYAMLAANEPVFPEIDERRWAGVTRYAELPFHDSVQAFSNQRGNLVRVLEGLPFESWERSALIFGRRHTVFTQTRRLAKHESVHMEQLDSILRL